MSPLADLSDLAISRTETLCFHINSRKCFVFKWESRMRFFFRYFIHESGGFSTGKVKYRRRGTSAFTHKMILWPVVKSGCFVQKAWGRQVGRLEDIFISPTPSFSCYSLESVGCSTGTTELGKGKLSREQAQEFTNTHDSLTSNCEWVLFVFPECSGLSGWTTGTFSPPQEHFPPPGPGVTEKEGHNHWGSDCFGGDWELRKWLYG
jgi:hypothetical protein